MEVALVKGFWLCDKFGHRQIDVRTADILPIRGLGDDEITHARVLWLPGQGRAPHLDVRPGECVPVTARAPHSEALRLRSSHCRQRSIEGIVQRRRFQRDAYPSLDRNRHCLAWAGIDGSQVWRKLQASVQRPGALNTPAGSRERAKDKLRLRLVRVCYSLFHSLIVTGFA